ncbi:MAG TPA: HAD family hydrolase [Polyangiaceae bacterium]|nr:HAD family hydrolase [Polyangiaceae bacterium]
MRYLTLVADYDGTLADRDRISEQTAQALERLRASGRRAIMVTGRRLDDLLAVCGQPKLFDLIVAENGAVIYDPGTRKETVLGNPPSKALLRALRARSVVPLEIGEVIVATLEPQRAAVQNVVWELGLELQVIGNRGAVMILPAGINKASGLECALRKLGLSRHEAVGIGDAENDHSFLERCECAVAVANATSSLKENVVHVTAHANGAGVRELIDDLIEDDLERLEERIDRNQLLLGRRLDGTPLRIPPYGRNILIAGPSGSGKSTLAAGLIERLIEKDYQVCIVDPEGDYGTLQELVALGNQRRAPSISEVLAILEDPKVNLSINLLGIQLADRPEFLAQMMPHVQALRMRTGRPHWLVLDEAHHMLPGSGGPADSALPRQLGETLLITVHPEHVSPEMLSTVDVVIAIGMAPGDTLARFARATSRELLWPEALGHHAGQVVVWFASAGQPPFAMQPEPGRAERIRHHRKYAEGDLRWHSFYFRGPEGRTNLKAHNLAMFSHLARGIDEETWMFHLRRGDYSRWFRHSIRDLQLAEQAERIERRQDLSPWQTRQLIAELIQARYTLPE